MQILSTKDYGLFKTINSNREVNASHVSKIKESILKKNLLSENPILANSDYAIVDGQHRLEAAKELGLEVFYIISDNVTHKDISVLNTNKKLWKLEDYLNFFASEGIDDYKQVSKFVIKHPKIPLTGAMLLLCSSYTGVQQDFKEGTFKVMSNEDANKMADQLQQLSVYGKHVWSIVFIRCFNKVARLDKFDFKRLIHKIEQAPKSFVPCINEKQTLEMIDEVYNRNTPTPNRLSFK